MNGADGRRLRVAMVSFDFGEICVRTANALTAWADVLLVLPRRELALARVEPAAGVSVEPFAKARLRQPVAQARMCAAIVRSVARFHPDVVHVQQGHLWFNLALGLLPRRPLVVTVHDASAHPGDRGGQRTPQAAMDVAFRRADQVIVHARSVGRAVVERTGRDPATVHLIPHVAIGMPPEEPPAGDDGRTVLFFGRIWPYKGLEHLIRAAPAIAEGFPGARFVVAGGGESLDRYRRMVAEPERFEFVEGFVPLDERDALFRRAAVVVLPYVEASQSGVVPVACAFARPVVATTVGGLPEVVDDGRTGLLVPPRDPARLAEAVVRLLRDPGLRRRMGAAGRRRLDAEWSPPAVAEQTVRVYERALAGAEARFAAAVAAGSTPPALAETEPRSAAAAEAAGAPPPRSPAGAARALHRRLVADHWRGDGLAGPDAGIRLNYRAGRFVKSYLRALPWRDDLYYLQAQGHWMLATWRLRDAGDPDGLGELARATARGVVARQRPDGAWTYPNREWRGRVANAEGTWAAIGLVETHRRTGEAAPLEAALRWHRFLEERIGYRPAGAGAAAGYFAGRPAGLVPNNSAFTLRLLAELADATGDRSFLRRAPAMVRFLAEAQLDSGELPYAAGPGGTDHFQCPQYNAFQALDLLRYRRLTGDEAAEPVAGGLLRFLRAKVRDDGSVPYGCDAETPRVSYHLAAVAAALHDGAALGGDGCAEAAQRVSTRLLALQRDDGGFPHSSGDYGRLSDRRSYPRPQAMILHHLLILARPPEAVA